MATTAYIAAGQKGAECNASRLIRNDRVAARIAELQTAVAERVVKREISKRDQFVEVLEDMHVMHESTGKTAVPGGSGAGSSRVGPGWFFYPLNVAEKNSGRGYFSMPIEGPSKKPCTSQWFRVADFETSLATAFVPVFKPGVKRRRGLENDPLCNVARAKVQLFARSRHFPAHSKYASRP